MIVNTLNFLVIIMLNVSLCDLKKLRPSVGPVVRLIDPSLSENGPGMTTDP